MHPGTRMGPYEIVAPVGAGGMGEVYRARDTRLDRDVAIKILPAAFANDADRLMRFTREAKTLASLNHPHIAQIYGIEHNALVMELVDGEDLSARIARGPVPMAEALAIARQVAEALEAAHEQGIIHRDLKPANIKVRDDGTVKVLDFGLAKAVTGEGSGVSSDALNSPTMTSPAMTAMGIVLGTAAYMAPEQAKGRAADRRADVWAFGVVLHEMLTGRPLFAGDDVTDTLVAVLSREPDPAMLPAHTPVALRRLLARCLAKDRRSRLDSMSAARLDIDEAMASPAPGAVAHARQTGKWMPAALLIAGLAAGALGAPWVWRGGADATATAGDAIVSSITATPDALSAFTYGFALSPDAATLVYTARGADGQRRLWKRRLAEPRAELIAGTEDAIYPFWSPDGRQVGFFAANMLKSVPLDGGPARTITEAPGRWPHGSWNEKDEILFSIAISGTFGIHRVAAGGGRSSQVPLDGVVWGPQWLPDGRHFLFSRIDETKVQVMTASVDGATAPATVIEHELAAGDAIREARLSSAGFLVFNRAGVLSRQRFNVETRQVEGPVDPIADRAGTPRAWLAVSVAGHTLTALNPPTGEIGGTPGDPVSRLVWVDRAGRVVGQLGAPARYWTLRLSHDGQRALVNPEGHLWTIDARTNLRTRVVRATGGVWMPGDREVLYRDGGRLWIRSVSGEGQPRLIPGSIERSGMPWDVSPDGRLVAVSAPRDDRSTSFAVWLLRLENGDRRLLAAGDFNAVQASFSPDGRRVAYSSDQTGRFEIYVREVEGDAPPIRLSADGGQHPFWRDNGAEIFFLSPTDEVVAVDVRALPRTGAPGARTTLFRMVTNDIAAEAFPAYAATPDGQRFLVNVPAAPEPVTLIQLPRGRAIR